jgi:hypothetical protein
LLKLRGSQTSKFKPLMSHILNSGVGEAITPKDSSTRSEKLATMVWYAVKEPKQQNIADSSEITARPASLSNLVQISEIYNHYILNTPNALFELPLSVVDILNIFRKSLELNFPLVVMVFKEAPHVILGFCFAADKVRLIKRPHLSTAGAFMREDMVNRGLYELGMTLLYRTIELTSMA